MVSLVPLFTGAVVPAGFRFAKGFAGVSRDAEVSLSAFKLVLRKLGWGWGGWVKHFRGIWFRLIHECETEGSHFELRRR